MTEQTTHPSYGEEITVRQFIDRLDLLEAEITALRDSAHGTPSLSPF